MKSKVLALIRRLSPFVPLLFAAGAAAADSWEVVVRDRDRQVELDRSSIIQSDGGTKVAWGRIVLTPAEAATAGYATIKALNRYDCYNRSFFTIKRVYLDSQQVVLREEGVIDQSPILVARKGVDERLWSEVCRPPTTSELQKVAAAAGMSAAAASADASPSAGAPSTKAPPMKTDAPARRAAPAEAPARIDPPARAGPPPTPAAPPSKAGPLPTPAAPPATLASAAPTPAPAARPPAAPVARASAPRPAPVAPRTSAPRAPAAPVDRNVRWSYDGDTGPEHWGSMRPEWALCSDGLRQSPIDLKDGIAVDLEPVGFDYRPSRFRITDTGHTLKVEVGEGMGVEIRGRRYELTHVQFHRPSEERVGGRAYDMVAHLHHRDLDGRIAIVAVLLERGDRPLSLVQTLWNNLPLERGSAYMPAVTIDLAGLVPASPAHYLYMGSLTTPPCTEGVLWVSMKEAVTVSDEQLRIFARLYPRNSRPIQPPNGRLVLESR